MGGFERLRVLVASSSPVPFNRCWRRRTAAIQSTFTIIEITTMNYTSCITVVVLAAGTVGPLVYSQEFSYRTGDEPTAEMYKSSDMKWFHLSESVTIRAEVLDSDEWCHPVHTDGEWVTSGFTASDGEFIPSNFIDRRTGQWTLAGADIVGVSGSYFIWSPSSHTGDSGIKVTAQFDDYENPESDDRSSAVAEEQLFAYRVQASLSGNGTEEHPDPLNNDGSGVLFLREGEIRDGFLVLSDLLRYDLGEPKKRLGVEHDHFKRNSDSPTSERKLAANATWSLDTQPNSAELSSGGLLAASTGIYIQDGLLSAITEDSDVLDGPIDSGSLSIGFSAIVSVSYTTPNMHFGSDTSEAAGWMGYAIRGTHLLEDQGKFDIRSAEQGDVFADHTGSIPINYGRITTVRGPKGTTSRAEVSVYRYGKVVDIMRDGPTSVFMETEIKGVANFEVSLVTYVGGELLPPEPGYGS